jgi:hypothetical protein
MLTREQYMNNECTHQEYYEQFITWSIRQYVQKNYTKEFLQQCFATDKNLNNLGDNWLKKFDAFTLQIKGEIASVNKRLNGSPVYSLSCGTCAIKAYMHLYADLK